VESYRRRLTGSALQQLRKLMGNSQAETATVLHVSREQISDYESGRRELRAGDLELLAEWWEIPLPTLMQRLGYAVTRDWPEFEDWYKARSGTIPTAADGLTTASEGGNAASEGGKRPLPRAKWLLGTAVLAGPTLQPAHP
jgi:transcriptional regulator with XRE-family HTH domain